MNIYYEMPSDEMDFWKINDNSHLISIKWTRNLSCDYQKMAEEFFRCGHSIFNEVIESGHDNIKSDMWFLPGIFMLRQSIELLLKSLICRVHMHKPEIQADLVECKTAFGKDYFRELLERVRSIRASERRIWQQITDIFAECSIDYSRDSEIAYHFYATIQNKFHYAITNHTAAEIVYISAGQL